MTGLLCKECVHMSFYLLLVDNTLYFFLSETDRQLRTNDHEYNSTFQYVNNYIRTSKYTLLTFLPLNLFEQFLRIANIYFLMQIIIMVSALIYFKK